MTRIVVAGAGSIGCFVGGLLALAGRDVTLLGRARVLDGIRDNGLQLTDFTGLDACVDAARLSLSDDPAVLAGADLVLVTVKTDATPEMAALIAQHAPQGATVVSLQNGHAAAQMLRAGLPGRDVRAGMVPFNVVPKGPGAYHRATSGDIVVGSGMGDVARVLSVPRLAVSEADDMDAIQWGKLLININNALNALSGLTLQAQLLDRDWRRLMADQMAETLAVLRAAGIAEQSTAPVPSRMIPFILRLPTPLFRRVAAQMIAIDAEARTSMAYDLDAGRGTEIDALQGEIIRLGQQYDVPTPICAHVAACVARAEPGLAMSVALLRP
ncbi:MAG: 2-dehydropantoate 2-reductase [Paracoccaceae bacterium]